MASEFDPRIAVWVKSTHSGPDGGECVEWAPSYASVHGVVPVRDSKRSDGPVLMVSAAAFTGLVTIARGPICR
ncbi:DUF397 domain-containing protein [Streptomyces clavuligerus]|uniref:DUF397 domain-containing protein n=1 Tax=Streptomyces clavuligerus TaxID=1901 RepID=B5H3L4_STRCL|nr:DUF397 domain-containing protein [Streptomyces clavuligerus]ANW19312.1 DUF397 domain-containing protein [Streptomyces clavuligerus]AXU13913.1 DUF397 domain-containing protein [Streptomyces clavuligerus]EDY53160.1 hypothetical protein SSCG_06197 [Streptomyces clavuligerus]EFG07916.1 DUF397 domain-containing protein [Streptomyces clavuligerus]MBY6303884.1 DUF397 domain-containing protein [Streptomyces clavuligerus]